jgi:hypothetical protein
VKRRLTSGGPVLTTTLANDLSAVSKVIQR